MAISSSIEFRRPGVTVQEIPLPRDTGTINSTQARAVVVGYLDRGPTEPVIVNSWVQFRSIFGDWSASVLNNRTVDAVYSFFTNAVAASSSLIVLRVTDASSTTATTTASDDEDVEVFTIDAASAGSWGNSLKVAIFTTPAEVAAFAEPDFNQDFATVDVASAGSFNIEFALFNEAGNMVGSPERYYGLSVDKTSRQYFEPLINSASRLVRVTHTDTTGLLLPASTVAGSPLALTGGTDREVGVTTWDLQVATTLSQLDTIDVPLVIYHASSDDAGAPIDGDIADVVTYSQNRADSFTIVDTPRVPGAGTAADVIDWVKSKITPKSAYAAAYYPWIQVNDPQRGPSGIVKVIPPGGSVLGAFVSTDATYGPWRTPAGSQVRLRNAVAADQLLSESDLKELNSANTPVNVIRTISGTGVCLMGGRTLDSTNADRYIAIRRSLSFITVNLKRISESALFEPNGPDLWEKLTIQMNDWLGRYYQQGALRGDREPDAFQVVINESNNTPSTISAGEVHIEVGVAVEFPAEFVIIRLTQQQGTVRN